jgi:hypothetical protein
LIDDFIDVLIDELHELAMALDRFLNGRDLIAGDVAGHVLAAPARLVVVVGPLGALADDGEGAAFHAGDLGGLLEEGLREGG